MLPTFLLIGSMRAGSTSLMRYLGAHPDVFVAREKEVHFFTRNYDRGIAWYEDRFTGAGGAHHVGEGTPHYFHSEEARARIRATLPDAKLLVTLRDPVERAYSHYWHSRARGKVDVDFATAVAAHASGEQSTVFVDKSRYLEPLRDLEPEYAAGRLHVLLFEDLRDAPDKTFDKVCEFLGIDAGNAPAIVGETLNRFTEFRSLPVQRFGRRLPKKARDALGRFNSKRANYPPMDAEVRAQLHELLVPDYDALAEWLGRDLAEWKT